MGGSGCNPFTKLQKDVEKHEEEEGEADQEAEESGEIEAVEKLFSD